MATAEERIAVLEAMVQELRAQLERPPRRDSMSQTLTCPCCGGGTILRVSEVMESKEARLVPFALGRAPGFWRASRGDKLQVFVCKECRFVEWHVEGIDHLVPNGTSVIELNRPADAAPPPDAPYR